MIGAPTSAAAATRIELPVIEPTRETPEQIAGAAGEIRSSPGSANAVVLAHNYQRPEVQDVADFVGDSLGLSRQAAKTPAERHHLRGRPLHGGDGGDPVARRSGCCCPTSRPAARSRPPSPPRTCGAGRRSFPDYIAVGYVNTTAEVKAELDYCCTSGNVLDVIDAIPADRGILFLPDFFLGAHVRRMRPDRRIEVWMGECHVHKGIRAGDAQRGARRASRRRGAGAPRVRLRGPADLRDGPGRHRARRACTSPRPRG